MSDERNLEVEIATLLADPQHQEHPLYEALATLFQLYKDNLSQIERVTSISDGYQSALQERHQSLSARYKKQMRQLQKIVRISDHYQEMMRDLNKALEFTSTHDTLTGLVNRRFLQERLLAETANAQRHQKPFSIALIDVDHFKRINDKYGHDIGDKALIYIANTLLSGLRGYDVCGRWGGEEFLVLFPNTTGPDAMEVAERLRALVAAPSSDEALKNMSYSICIGVAQHQLNEEMNSTLKRADNALFQAKQDGRNKVALAD